MTAFNVPSNYAFDNYDSLVAGINDWLDRNDLAGSAQSMIALAEARMRRELTPHFSETSASISVTDGIGALPGDFGTINRVSYNNYAIPQVSLVSAFNVPVYGTCPEAYTIEGGSLRVWPSGNFVLGLIYQPTLPKLSETTPTNILLSSHPDLYFFGSMMFANGYLANDQRAALFKGLWDEAIQSAKSYMARQKYDGPLVPRTAFVP